MLKLIACCRKFLLTVFNDFTLFITAKQNLQSCQEKQRLICSDNICIYKFMALTSKLAYLAYTLVFVSTFEENDGTFMIELKTTLIF